MLKVNGKERPFDVEISLVDFLKQEGYQLERIAVEWNGNIVKKANYADVLLHSGDVLEVVSFVGGG